MCAAVTLDAEGWVDWHSVDAFFARQLPQELRLVSGDEVLYGTRKEFVQTTLCGGAPVNNDDPVVLRNFSEASVVKRCFDKFKSAINALTIDGSGTSRMGNAIPLRDARLFRMPSRQWLPTRRSPFNRFVGELGHEGFEWRFARFLGEAPGIAVFALSHFAVGLRIDRIEAESDISTYTPHFIVRAVEAQPG